MGVLPRLLRSCVRRNQHRRGAVHAAKSLNIGLLACALALWLAASPALANTPPNALPPAVLAQTTTELALAGRGRLTFWGFEVYDAALWTGRGFRASQFDSHPFVLELTYQRNFSADEISRVSLKEMRRHGEFDAAQAERWQAQLTAALPDVRRGDRLAGVHRPGQGVSFFHNGRLSGEVADAQFARLFFAIWLGEAT